MKLAVLTPCLTGSVHIEHSDSMGALRVEAYKRGIELKHYWNKGSSILPRNRNVLAAAALADGCDWIMWVDDDIAFSPQDVFRLLAHDVDLVGVCAQRCTKKWGEVGFIVHDFDLENPDVRPDGLIRANGVATAFQLVRASVFLRMDVPPLRHRDSPARINEHLREWYAYEREGDEDLGEDYTFCRRCHRVGIETLIDPDIRVRHYEGNVEHPLSLRDVFMARDARKQQVREMANG